MNSTNMKDSKKPQRMCIACKAMKDKKELLRIVKTPEGEIELDFTSKKNGRGAYVCKDLECISKCRKGKILNRAFHQEISDDVYKKLEEDYSVGTR